MKEMLHAASECLRLCSSRIMFPHSSGYKNRKSNDKIYYSLIFNFILFVQSDSCTQVQVKNTTTRKPSRASIFQNCLVVSEVSLLL